MIEYNESILRSIIFHRVSVDESKTYISDKAFKCENEEEEDILKKIFLKQFSSISTTYELKHHIDINLNSLYKISKELYNGNSLEQSSKDVFQHLQSVSKHHNIKDGDLFVAKFEDIRLNNKFYEAVGIYKIENKESFIDTTSDTGKKGIIFKKGIGSKKIDKACLIIFTEKSFTVLVIDNNSVETDYWTNEFINVKLKKDGVNSTNHILNIAKSFVTQELPNEFEVTKAIQVDFMNRSVDYFKSHDEFNKDEFEKEVLVDSQVIDSFRKFDETYCKENKLDIPNDFQISPIAVKKQSRIFKNVIKLDKNFQIHIHQNSSLIENGIDKDGRKFYKIYYEEES